MKILSHHTTGVCRAALDASIKNVVPCSGWIPARLDDKLFKSKYNLKNHSTNNFFDCVRRNVSGSHATLVVQWVFREKYTAPDLAFREALPHRLALSACYTSDKELQVSIDSAVKWIDRTLNLPPELILNIIGPDESKAPSIYKPAFVMIDRIIKRVNKLYG